MTKQQKLKFQNDHGETVIFQHPEDNDYIAIGGARKDKKGDYRITDWHNSVEECMQNLGYYNGFTSEYLEEKLKSWKYIDSIPPKYNPVPVKTKVRILENAKEECDKVDISWDDEKEEMIGNVYEITDINGGDYYINDWLFPRSAFVIAEDEEEVEEETIMIKNGKQYKVKIIEEIK